MTITGEGIAKLYMDHVYRWFGLPDKVISDRDPRFTSHFTKGLTRTLGIQQNISTAFHPQMDGVTDAWGPDSKTGFLAPAGRLNRRRKVELTQGTSVCANEM